MSQGKNRKSIAKKARKGFKGYPMATVAFYGPTNRLATKAVCSIIEVEDGEPAHINKWFSESDIRKSERIIGEVLLFIENHEAKSVSMLDQIIGCPHEEGIDYPEGEYCPQCRYWKGRDRFTHELLH